jgi:hypothetical protein
MALAVLMVLQARLVRRVHRESGALTGQKVRKARKVFRAFRVK